MYCLSKDQRDYQWLIKFSFMLMDCKQDYGKWGILVLVYQMFGVVFGGLVIFLFYVWLIIQIFDFGEIEFLGVLSFIFWIFMLVVLVKYGFIVINVDDYGEGLFF